MEQGWHLRRQETIHQDKFVEIQRNDYDLPRGEHLDDYVLLHEQDGVHIVALNEAHEMLMVRQYRVGADDFLYEFPAGFVESDEHDPLERAKRELREETGYEATHWQPLGAIYPAPNRMRKREHGFLALGARRVAEQDLESTESVRFERVALDPVRQMAAAGQLTSASVLAMLYKALVVLDSQTGSS